MFQNVYHILSLCIESKQVYTCMERSIEGFQTQDTSKLSLVLLADYPALFLNYVGADVAFICGHVYDLIYEEQNADYVLSYMDWNMASFALWKLSMFFHNMGLVCPFPSDKM